MDGDWNGKERRKIIAHQTPLAECIQRYQGIVEKLDSLILRFDRINGKYDSHLIESVAYRAAVDAHTKRFDIMEDQTRWVIGLLISIVITIAAQIITFSFLWGQWTKRVEINTVRLDQIEMIHPRHVEETK